MASSESESSTTKDERDRTGDPDFSLNEFFEEDWNLTDGKKNNKSPSASITKVENSQNPDPDNTLNDFFQEDWSYDPTENQSPVTFETANPDRTSWWGKPKSYSKSAEEQENALAKMLFCSFITRIEKQEKCTILEIIERESAGAFCLLLNADYELIALNEKAQTALHLIFYKKAWELLALLDLKFADYPETLNRINLKDSEGLTHLHIACARGSLKLVERFLSNNKDDINASYNADDLSNIFSGFTALHFAVTNPDVCKKKIVAKLIELGANVQTVDSKGRTPLHIASRVYKKNEDSKSDGKINIEVMGMLEKHQHDIDVKDVHGNTPLLSTFSLAYEEFEMKGSSSTPYTDCYTANYHISQYMAETKRKLQFFLEHGADVTVANKKNENVLHRILANLKGYRQLLQSDDYKFDESDHLDMIKHILSINPKVDLNLKNHKGESPLQMAVACMCPKIVKFLLNNRADLANLTFKVKGQRDFFCYPNLVPTFEPIQDLMNVLELLSDRGFSMSLQDNIMVFKFLLHDTKYYCKCVNNTFSNIDQVLHYGTESHVKNVLDDLSDDLQRKTESVGSVDSHYSDYTLSKDMRSDCIGGLGSDLLDYLCTMELADIHRDEDVIKIIRNIVEDVLDEESSPTVGILAATSKDLEKLKAVKFENNVSLHDILKKDPRDTPRAIVHDFDLKLIQNLGCYKEAVKGHITKARVRFFFEWYSNNYLKLIYDSLPDVCCRMIVCYLSNKDILNLCLATAILTSTKQNLFV